MTGLLITLLSGVFLTCVLGTPVGLLVGIAPSVALLQGAAGGAQRGPQNTWTATSSNGRTFVGTWTVVPDRVTGAVGGTWTLLDAQGRTVARGGWSATKTPAGWSGRWRAAPAGGGAEYAGTWSANVRLEPNAPFSDLFEGALQGVSGGWRAGGYSGSWSIRAYQ
jgi:hypothetical protein